MIRAIGYSVITQGIVSGGTFVLTVLMLRVLSLEVFGLYVLLTMFASICSGVVNAACGNVYHLLRPELEFQKQLYERNYNGLHASALAAVATIAITACNIFSPQVEAKLGIALITLFIVEVTAVDSLKLQATANGRYRLILQVEILRQAALLSYAALLTWRGSAHLDELVFAHGLIGIGACIGIMLGIDWRISFRRFTWVARRHLQYARYLIPSTLITIVHSSAMSLILARYFGSEALAVLRAAELPFNVLNPFKSSLAYFLPRAIHRIKREAADGRQLAFYAGALLSLLLIVCALLWAVSIPLYPVLTKKDYPTLAGVFFGFAYVGFFVIAVTEIWLNILGRSHFVFNQNIFGAISAIVVFAITAPLFGYLSGAISVAATAFVMAVYGCLALVGSYGVSRKHLMSLGFRANTLN